MITANHHTGRLIELTFVFPYTTEEIHNIGVEIGRVFQKVPGQLVGISDMRRGDLLHQEQVNLFVPILKSDNPKIERSAFLIKPGAILGMQVERILREAGNPNRRTFLEVASAVAWLSEVLTPAEVARVQAFLAENETKSAA